MPTHSAPDPIEAATKAIDALLSAINGNPGAGAVAAYRAAITRHGRGLVEAAGPEALDTVRDRVASMAPLAAEGRRATIAAAWGRIIWANAPHA
ncbi:hypothetical protein ABS772_26190 [Methylorubrum podarium]|uniref:Histidinol dehydrogenase n=1 Tax=Methylorubrum podarium TaxID=200476 RepID=A0ABV1QVQ0_9HYPH